MEELQPDYDKDKLILDGYAVTLISFKDNGFIPAEVKTCITAVCPNGYHVASVTIKDIQLVTQGFQKVRRAIHRHKKKLETIQK